MMIDDCRLRIDPDRQYVDNRQSPMMGRTRQSTVANPQSTRLSPNRVPVTPRRCGPRQRRARRGTSGRSAAASLACASALHNCSSRPGRSPSPARATRRTGAVVFGDRGDRASSASVPHTATVSGRERFSRPAGTNPFGALLPSSVAPPSARRGARRCRRSTARPRGARRRRASSAFRARPALRPA